MSGQEGGEGIWKKGSEEALRSSRGMVGDCKLGTPGLAVCAAHIGGSCAVEKSRLNRGARGPEVESLAGSHEDR